MEVDLIERTSVDRSLRLPDEPVDGGSIRSNLRSNRECLDLLQDGAVAVMLVGVCRFGHIMHMIWMRVLLCRQVMLIMRMVCVCVLLTMHTRRFFPAVDKNLYMRAADTALGIIYRMDFKLAQKQSVHCL